MKRILHEYEVASGQCINFHKSALCFSPNVPSDRKEYLASLLGVSVVEDLGYYLGLPSHISRRKSAVFCRIKEQIGKAVQGWKRSFFSVGGKEVLLKSVAQAIPTYSMSCFRLPKGLCSDISREMARFWWGSSGEKHKIHWQGWDRLCVPKKAGGLNFWDMEGFNQALLAKQVWRVLQNPNILLSRLLRGKYFADSLVLKAGCPRSASYFWHSFIWGRELLYLGLRRRIGDGSDTLFF